MSFGSVRAIAHCMDLGWRLRCDAFAGVVLYDMYVYIGYGKKRGDYRVGEMLRRLRCSIEQDLKSRSK